MTAVVAADVDGISRAVGIIQSGGVVAIPTETVYGLAANAFDVSAVAKIFAAKERPTFDPLIVHVPTSMDSIDALCDANIVDRHRVSAGTRALCERLMQEFWPGPLTLVLPKHQKIPDLVTAGLPHVGIRMPSHRVAKRILLEAKTPLAAPSANRFGRISPTTAAHVFAELDGRIPLIVDGGASAVGVESTVVLVNDNLIGILRPGGIALEDLQRVAGAQAKVERQSGVAGTGSALLAPGSTASHYAPRKPVVLWHDRIESVSQSLQNFVDKSQAIAILFAKGDPANRMHAIPASIRPFMTGVSLSNDGNPSEAARNLFSTLRKLDESDAHVIFAEEPSESSGLWYAIHDRLSRAATRP